MKTKTKNLAILLVMGLIFPLILNYDFNFNSTHKPKVVTPKSSGGYTETFIHIDGINPKNWSWTAGNNSWCYFDNGYYIIENVTIDRSGLPIGSGILINNSNDVNFIVRNCTISNVLGHTANDNRQGGIKLVNSSRGILRNNTCSDSRNYGSGILVYDDSHNITIENNFINSHPYHGISLSSPMGAGPTYNITIKNNIIHKSGYYGIYLWDSDNVTIKDNNADDNNMIGIYLVVDCVDNKIINNNASDNGVGFTQEQGIYLDGCDNNTILGNNVSGNGDGIYLKNSDNNTIQGNIVNDNGDDGIDLNVNCDYNRVLGNFVNNTGRFTANSEGIQVYQNSHFNKISNNNVSYNYDGIRVGKGSYNNTILKNNLHHNTHAGIYIDPYDGLGCEDNKIINNTVSSNGRYGIYLTGTVVYSCENNTITGNAVNNNAKHGIYLETNSKWNNITKNEVNDNSLIGIYLYYNCDNNTIKNNTINRNDLGIGLFRSDYNNITENILIDNGYCIYEYNCVGNLNESNYCTGSTLQAPISIDDLPASTNDWAWARTQSWCTQGTGALGDPYIIENLIISGFEVINGIKIVNSNVSFIIQDCTVYNSDDAGIYLYNVSNSRLINNNCSNNIDYGLYLEESCHNNTIYNNTANNNEEDGIEFYYDCSWNNVTGNIINYNEEQGINLEGNFHNNTIYNNTANYNGYTGIYFYNDCSWNNVTGNIVNYNEEDGIRFYADCSWNNVTGNIVNYNEEEGIYLEWSNNNTIYNNTANYNELYGIVISDDCHQNNVINNTVNENKGGILLSGGFPQGTNNRIINNTVNNNSEYGIFLQDCDDNNITGNTVNDNGANGIFLTFSDHNNIINNTANLNGKAGISIYQQNFDCTIVNNIANENIMYGIEVYNSGSHNIINNTVNHNGHTGIYLKWVGSDSNNITGNTINDNVKIGIYLYNNCENNNIKNNTINRNNLGIGLIENSNSNTISDNILIDNGMCIFEIGCTGNIIENNTCSESFKELPIFINGTATGVGAHNWTWVEQQSWFGGGSGSKGAPYIIENLERDGLAVTDCIEIINSDVYFIVKNCTFYNSGSSSAGIMLINVSNGILTENNCSFNNWGIFLDSDCDFNNITSNIVDNNDNTGITLGSDCDFINIIENNVDNNDGTGIILRTYCDFNNITGNEANNNAMHGISIDDECDNNTISNNFANYNGEAGIFLTGAGAGSCENNTFSENTANDNNYGIRLVTGCHFTKISGNVIYRNNIGIFLEGFNLNYNDVLENVMCNNTLGIKLNSGCNNNSLYENFFLKNGKHAEDWGPDNYWNSTTIGNYWDNHTAPDEDPEDGIVDIQYNISGTPGGIDYLPIAEDGAPIIDIISPVSGDTFAVATPSFDVVINDDYLDEMWYTIDGGLNNYSFTENGLLNQLAWGTEAEGNITLTFYASDIPGNIGTEEVMIVKDYEAPTININSPTTSQFFGSSAPSFNIRIIEDYLDTMWYTLDGGLNNYTFTANGTIDQSAWNSMADGPIILGFFTNDTLGHIGSTGVTINKDTVVPVIIINSPTEGEKFGNTAPLFNITITENNLDAIWYSFDVGVTNHTITISGTLDQTAWTALSKGEVTITIYARDLAGNEASENITIIKYIPSGLEPEVIIIIVVVSVIGGLAIIGVILGILIKKGKISLEKLKSFSFRKK